MKPIINQHFRYRQSIQKIYRLDITILLIRNNRDNNTN
jgi:hypothetical protein